MSGTIFTISFQVCGKIYNIPRIKELEKILSYSKVKWLAQLFFFTISSKKVTAKWIIFSLWLHNVNLKNSKTYINKGLDWGGGQWQFGVLIAFFPFLCINMCNASKAHFQTKFVIMEKNIYVFMSENFKRKHFSFH